DLQHQRLRVTPQPDASGLAPRVSMNVDQRLLNDPKERGLGVERQPLEALGQLEVHGDAAALGKSGGVPSQRQQEARLVQKGRVKEIRQRAYPGDRLVGERDALDQ